MKIEIKKTLDINNTKIAYAKDKKRLPKGKYKYVYPYQLIDGTKVYQSNISKYKWSKYHNTEKEAALAVDRFLISKGKNPINVLKSINKNYFNFKYV